eukprot:11631319-Prorocentrum_lima.AAC.1
MTSSLVGSEMCIRDSHSPQAFVAVSVMSGMAVQCLNRKGKAMPRYQGLKAVSYTHLTLPTICSV